MSKIEIDLKDDFETIKDSKGYLLPKYNVIDGKGIEKTGEKLKLEFVKGSRLGCENIEKNDGILHETLLSVMIVDLKNKNKLVPSDETIAAINYLESALFQLYKRQINRAKDGILGTYAKVKAEKTDFDYLHEVRSTISKIELPLYIKIQPNPANSEFGENTKNTYSILVAFQKSLKGKYLESCWVQASELHQELRDTLAYTKKIHPELFLDKKENKPKEPKEKTEEDYIMELDKIIKKHPLGFIKLSKTKAGESETDSFLYKITFSVYSHIYGKLDYGKDSIQARDLKDELKQMLDRAGVSKTKQQ